MKKTININIAGIVFQIDDDAFEKLRSYLQEVNNRFRRIQGGSEALEDFEARVAEILQGRRGITGIVTLEDVDEIISVMGRPEDIDDGYDDEPENEPVSTGQRRLYRNPDETIIAGVGGGIGAYLNVDPVWIRLLFILFTVFYGFGFFVYIALWIALPVANDEPRKRELYGSRYSSSTYSGRRSRKGTHNGSRPAGSDAAERVGGALNEIFRAIGRLIVVAFRIILIFIGTSLIIMGFAFLALVIIALFFNYGPWLPDSMATESLYFSDIMPLIVTPSVIPWVAILSMVLLALPLIALIYWGIKMIFRFRARDGVVSIIALVIWILAAVSLTMILFHEGISFAESGRETTRIELTSANNSLFLGQGNELRESDYEKKIRFAPMDEDFWFYTTPEGKIYCSAMVNIHSTTEEEAYAEVKKYGHGTSTRIAMEKAGRLEYNYSFSNDSLIVDSFFGLPDKSRWNGSMVKVNIYLPEGTRIFIDENIEPVIANAPVYPHRTWDLGGKWWTMTENGLTLN
ncbi:MAG: PspC domain-containing protein [Bacteroidales bacterium]|nr:PspC domain-containing protein [Bacteroidales bacterium]